MVHAWMKVESQLKQIQVVLKERHSDLEAVFTFTCSDPVLQAASKPLGAQDPLGWLLTVSPVHETVASLHIFVE